jgi:hypothetical protein
MPSSFFAVLPVRPNGRLEVSGLVGNEAAVAGVELVVTARATLLVTAALILTSCSGDPDSSDAPQPTVEWEAPAVALAASVAATEGTCPLTLPNGDMPPGADVGANHGNGKLWTAMWPYNVVIATPHYVGADGSVSMKWGWWRGVTGKLRITGRRLDGDAPPLTAYVPDGYGRSGFQVSGITFPTEGCWEVTGAVGEAELTFVTLILKAERYWPLPETGETP